MENVTTASFSPGQTEAVADTRLLQWDYGQVLRFDGLELSSAYQVDFSNTEYCGASIARVGNAEGVQIPNELLTTGAYVYAFLWLQGEGNGRTQYRVTIPVTARPAPVPEKPSPEETSAITGAIAALNAAVEQTDASTAAAAESAEEAAQSAGDAGDAAALSESWAVGGTGTRDGEDTDNSKFWAMVAQQGAEHSGYAIFDVNTEDGHMYVTVSSPLNDDVEFRVNEQLGTLEVSIYG